MGYIRERRPFGVYGRRAVSGDEVFIHDLPSELTSEFLAGARSVLINADTGGTSITLYQRLGLTDEAHWPENYLYQP